jgi:hypothetical protein
MVTDIHETETQAHGETSTPNKELKTYTEEEKQEIMKTLLGGLIKNIEIFDRSIVAQALHYDQISTKYT